MMPSNELLLSICCHLTGPATIHWFLFYPTTFINPTDIVLPPGLVLSRISVLPMRNKVHLVILFLMALNGCEATTTLTVKQISEGCEKSH